MTTAWTFDPALDDRAAEIAWQTRELTPESPLTEKLRILSNLVPTLARMTEVDRVAAQEKLKERLGLPAKYLTAFQKDIQKAVKNKAKTQEKSNGQEKYIALFDRLVDLVEHEGHPVFLIKQDGVLGMRPGRRRRELPAPRAQSLVTGPQRRSYQSLQVAESRERYMTTGYFGVFLNFRAIYTT
jgi:hypothetical protein